VAVEAGGVGGGVFALCALGDEDEENLDEKLDSHELRREVLGDGDTDFGRLLLSVIVFSVDALLE
jgi:hypothetical protein